MQKLEDTSTPYTVGLAILGYSLCSSTLLLANKMAMVHLPSPSLVSFIQIFSSTITVLLLKYVVGVKIDDFDLTACKAYAIYTVAFVASIYTNMQALSSSNVETVIVFRACTPITVGIIEYFFMDRAWPSLRSSGSLVVVTTGAVIYCLSDSEFIVNGVAAYFWAIMYFVCITFEMTYGKNITSSVKMDSVWGPVLYCNAMAALPMFLIGYFNGDFVNVSEKLSDISPVGMSILFFSCVVGTLIGYTGWLCRGMVSATTFTLVGVINKFITVLLNVGIWDKHSSPTGLVAVCLCLLAGSLYQQAPRVDDTRKAELEMQKVTDQEAGKGEESTNPLLEKKGLRFFS